MSHVTKILQNFWLILVKINFELYKKNNLNPQIWKEITFDFSKKKTLIFLTNLKKTLKFSKHLIIADIIYIFFISYSIWY